MPSSAAIALIDSASWPARSRISRAAARPRLPRTSPAGATIASARGVSSSGALEAIGGAQAVADRAVEEDVERPDERPDEEGRWQEADDREEAEGERAPNAMQRVVGRHGAARHLTVHQRAPVA